MCDCARGCFLCNGVLMWTSVVNCTTEDYTPILIQNPHGDDFRMRSVGVIAGNGPSITVFDMVSKMNE